MTSPEDRAVLIGQVAYLVDELKAQRAVVDFVPDPVWRATLPTGEHSLLELYGLIVALGERSYPGVLDAWDEGGPSVVQSVDEDDLRDSEPWNGADPHDLLERAVRAREAVVARFEGMPDDAWSAERTVDGQPETLARFAYRITQEDTAILRVVSERLYEAGLGGSPVTRD